MGFRDGRITQGTMTCPVCGKLCIAIHREKSQVDPQVIMEYATHPGAEGVCVRAIRVPQWVGSH